MVVEASDEPKLVDDMDEDDQPLVFKRRSSASKQQIPKSETKTGSPVPQERSQNGQSASVQKSKTIPSAKASPGRSPLASPNVSYSSTEVSAVKCSKTDLQPCGSRGDYAKSKMQLTKDGNPSTRPANKSIVSSEDSEDEKPLSARIVGGSLKTQSLSNNPNKRPNAAASSQKPKIPKSEDCDDEVNLSSKVQAKATAGTSTDRSSGSTEKRPLLSKHGQNGSTTMEMKPPSILKKRPAESIESAADSKRPKLSNASISNKRKDTSVKSEIKDEDDEDNVPISQRGKKLASSDKKSSLEKKVSKATSASSKMTNKKPNKLIKDSEYSKSSNVPPGSGEGQKWTTLVHNGVIFPPPYKPHGVKMLYKGKPIQLTPEQEEVATMFAVMLDTDYMSKPRFRENFMSDWQKILGKNHVIQDLEHCDFTPIYEWHQKEKEKKKQMSTEEKKAIKEEKAKQEEKYMWAIVDGVKEKVGNFRVEPPGLFRGRGEHPKMGMLKKRIRPNDIIINIGKDAPIPECPIPGESWKEIRHDNTVTWLAYWTDPINPKLFKYVFLAPSSTLKGQSDKEKYEKARLLKEEITSIREAYTKDFTNKDETRKQIAVATYLIDKLALRAGNEKDEDEADTVGCCTLKVENVEPVPPNKLKFDFLGKDSIRYFNEIEVELAVFKAIQQFRRGKKGGDDLFDKIDTSRLNSHLKELMPGLTAKVFRTYNASITLDDMLSRNTEGGDIAEKMVIYNSANKEVALICNHQRAVSKSHEAQMSRIDDKIERLQGSLEELKTDLARAKKGKPPLKSPDGKTKRNLNPDALERNISQATKRLEKLKLDKKTKEDLKNVALGTSKINYLDPRITVAWCKRHEVPIEKMFNKSLLAKFAWAMDVDPSFRF